MEILTKLNNETCEILPECVNYFTSRKAIDEQPDERRKNAGIANSFTCSIILYS